MFLLDWREVSFFVLGFAQTRPLRMASGHPQGDPISPALFVFALERTLGPLWNQWRDAGECIPAEGGPIPAAASADDVYVLGTRAETQMSTRMDGMSNAVRREGLGLVPHKCCWLITVKNPREVLLVSGGTSTIDTSVGL